MGFEFRTSREVRQLLGRSLINAVATPAFGYNPILHVRRRASRERPPCAPVTFVGPRCDQCVDSEMPGLPGRLRLSPGPLARDSGGGLGWFPVSWRFSLRWYLPLAFAARLLGFPSESRSADCSSCFSAALWRTPLPAPSPDSHFWPAESF